MIFFRFKILLNHQIWHKPYKMSFASGHFGKWRPYCWHVENCIFNLKSLLLTPLVVYNKLYLYFLCMANGRGVGGLKIMIWCQNNQNCIFLSHSRSKASFVAVMLENGGHIVYFCVANVLFWKSRPRTYFVQNLALVSQSERSFH